MAARQQILLLRLAVLACLACLACDGSVRAQIADSPPGEQAAYAFRANTVRVISDGLPDDGAEEGFGFVFAQRGSTVYIATADHVVRAGDTAAKVIQVEFFQAQGRPVLAELQPLRLPKGEGDLALLQATAPADFHPVWLAVSPVLSLHPGSRAWRIGRDQKWVPPTSAGGYGGLAPGALLLDFESLDTPRGSSGGPVVGDGGLIGMVVEAKNAGRSSNVLPAETIATVMRGREIPWDIRLPGAPTSVSSPALGPPEPPPTAALVRHGRAELERSAYQLLGTMVDAYGQDPASLAKRLDSVYAPVLVHNGDFVRRADLIGEKLRLAQTYPYRRAQIRSGSVVLDCNVDVGSCRIQAIVEWQRGGPGGLQQGRSDLTYSAMFASGAPQIRLEIESMPTRR